MIETLRILDRILEGRGEKLDRKGSRSRSRPEAGTPYVLGVSRLVEQREGELGRLEQGLEVSPRGVVAQDVLSSLVDEGFATAGRIATVCGLPLASVLVVVEVLRSAGLVRVRQGKRGALIVSRAPGE